MYKKIIPALLAFSAVCAHASDYFVVVPLKGKADAMCALPWGGMLPAGESVTAYSISNPVFGVSCASVAEERQCGAGKLSGEYTNQTCVEALSTTTWDVNNVWANSASKTSAEGPRVTLWNGNLTVAEGSGGYSDGAPYAYATQARSTGKWYFEFYVHNTLYRDLYLGLAAGHPASWEASLMSNAEGGVWAGSASGPAISYGAGSRLGFAVDLDTNKVWVSHNCVWTAGTPDAGTPSATLVGRTMAIRPAWHGSSTWAYGYQNQVTANFGNSAFGCTVPTGFTPGW